MQFYEASKSIIHLSRQCKATWTKFGHIFYKLKYKFIVCVFPYSGWMRRFMAWISVFKTNTAKYRPEKNFDISCSARYECVVINGFTLPQNGQTHSINSPASTDKLFEGVWSFCSWRKVFGKFWRISKKTLQ